MLLVALFLTAGSIGTMTPEALGQETILLQEGDVWDYFKGTEEPTPDELGAPTLEWADLDFDIDDSWLTGPGGIGYGDGDDQTVLDDMRDNYASVYMRTFFEVDDADAVGAGDAEGVAAAAEVHGGDFFDLRQRIHRRNVVGPRLREARVATDLR